MLKSQGEVQIFRDQERLASFATVDSNKPHVVPVFFTYENGKVYVQNDRESDARDVEKLLLAKMRPPQNKL